MSSNIFIALITSLSTLIAALGGAALGYYFNERRENKLKIEKKEDLKRIVKAELSNAQLEIIDNMSIFVRLSTLYYKIGNYDYARMINQVNKITISEITKFNNNMFLNEKQRNLAREMYFIKSIKEKLKLALDLYNHKIANHKIIGASIDEGIETLEKINKSCSLLLKQ